LAQRDLIIQFSIDYGKKFLNWPRNKCVVSIITTATWHTWLRTTYHRRTINDWQNDYASMSMLKDNIRTRVVTFYTAKHFLFRQKHCLKDLTFLFIRQHNCGMTRSEGLLR